MKKIAMWLVMVLGLCLGCESNEPTVKIDLKFRRGQTVNLVVGGKGQIIDIDADDRRGLVYRVRVNTNEGPVYRWFREFELEIQ
jgi:hypothetical protein